MTPEPAEVTYCRASHPRRTRAVACIVWPDGSGRRIPTCRGCLNNMVREAVDEGERILIEPVFPVMAGGVGRGW